MNDRQASEELKQSYNKIRKNVMVIIAQHKPTSRPRTVKLMDEYVEWDLMQQRKPFLQNINITAYQNWYEKLAKALKDEIILSTPAKTKKQLQAKRALAKQHLIEEIAQYRAEFYRMNDKIKFRPETITLAEDVYQLRLSHVDKITSGAMPEDEFNEYKNKLHHLSNKLADSMEADNKTSWWHRLIHKVGKWALNAYINAHKPIEIEGPTKGET